MIPECLKDKRIKFQKENIPVPNESWIKVKRNYYSITIPVIGVSCNDLVLVDLNGALVKRITIDNGCITLYANKHLGFFTINVYVLDDPKLKVGVSTTKDKYYMADPEKR